MLVHGFLGHSRPPLSLLACLQLQNSEHSAAYELLQLFAYGTWQEYRGEGPSFYYSYPLPSCAAALLAKTTATLYPPKGARKQTQRGCHCAINFQLPESTAYLWCLHPHRPCGHLIQMHITLPPKVLAAPPQPQCCALPLPRPLPCSRPRKVPAAVRGAAAQAQAAEPGVGCRRPSHAGVSQT